VLEVGGLHWATSESVVENVLSRRPGVLGVEANAVSQTATVSYDPARASVAELSAWVRDCGYHCAGQSVPEHVCDPMTEPADPHVACAGPHGGHGDHAAAAGTRSAVEDADRGDTRVAEEHELHEGRTPQDVMGHGGSSRGDVDG
jgi:Cu2+-exporting ATPase